MGCKPVVAVSWSGAEAEIVTARGFDRSDVCSLMAGADGHGDMVSEMGISSACERRGVTVCTGLGSGWTDGVAV